MGAGSIAVAAAAAAAAVTSCLETATTEWVGMQAQPVGLQEIVFCPTGSCSCGLRMAEPYPFHLDLVLLATVLTETRVVKSNTCG